MISSITTFWDFSSLMSLFFFKSSIFFLSSLRMLKCWAKRAVVWLNEGKANLFSATFLWLLWGNPFPGSSKCFYDDPLKNRCSYCLLARPREFFISKDDLGSCFDGLLKEREAAIGSVWAAKWIFWYCITLVSEARISFKSSSKSVSFPYKYILFCIVGMQNNSAWIGKIAVVLVYRHFQQSIIRWCRLKESI